jgi:aminopeptidase YwaD
MLMRTWNVARLLAVVLVVAVLAAPAVSAPPSLGEEALRHVEALAALGPRVAGSGVDRRAADYIAGQVRALGYEVQLQPFPFFFFETRDVSLQVAGVDRVTLEPRTLIYSPSTSGVLTAEIAGAGLGRPADLGGANLRGRIALLQRGEIRFSEKVANAAEAGAVAVVIYNNEPGNITGTLGAPSRIPAVMIQLAEGQRILEMLQSGPVTATLRVDTLNEERTTWNVIGTLPGRSGRRILIGGHYDSVEGSPGANDNASGVAAALVAARLLRENPPAAGVEIVAFGAEELGLYGSQFYARSPRVQQILGMINLDMVGVGDRLQIGNSGGDARLVDAALEAARSLRISVTRTRMGASDHLPLERAGVPVVFLHWTDDPNYHSPQDTADKVRPDRLEAAIRIAVGTARSRAASGQGIPSMPALALASAAGAAFR